MALSFNPHPSAPTSPQPGRFAHTSGSSARGSRSSTRHIDRGWQSAQSLGPPLGRGVARTWSWTWISAGRSLDVQAPKLGANGRRVSTKMNFDRPSCGHGIHQQSTSIFDGRDQLIHSSSVWDFVTPGRHGLRSSFPSFARPAWWAA